VSTNTQAHLDDHHDATSILTTNPPNSLCTLIHHSQYATRSKHPAIACLFRVRVHTGKEHFHAVGIQLTVNTVHYNLISRRIPLNDDRQEKANRLQSRKAQDDAQLNQIKAAATPLRNKRRSLLGGASPRTPLQDDEDGMPAVGGNAVTPMKRVPILANFEEWMKMATDNVRSDVPLKTCWSLIWDRKSTRQTRGTSH
jgi:hypothetical protein